jgi:signal transduction histidine kinase
VTERRVPAGRLRRRLAVAFTLAAGLAAAALALSSYLVVRDSRLDDSVDRALTQTRFNLVLAAEVLAPGTGEARTDELLAAFERRGEFATVGTASGRSFSSSVSLGAAQVPDELVGLVGRGDLAYQRSTVAETPYVVAGGPVAGTDVELYFFFSEATVRDELRELGLILLAGVALVTLLAAFAGAVLARRTLAPVARASAAARSLAEGLLETRIPVRRADEFGAWAASFNEMADALQGKIAALSAAQARERRFTADVAHELRTPLTALVGEAALLGAHLDRMPAEARRPAELIVADVARLRRLVEDLMEISRLDAGAEPVRRDRVALGEVVRAAAGGDGQVRVEDDGVSLTTDRRRVERIVSNLVGNALEHAGAAEIRVTRDGDWALVHVSDSGPGIAAEHLPHVFDRFYKVDPARTGHGSGLGLAIARDNARLLGGDVVVASEPGRGSRFTVRLPVAEPLRGRHGADEDRGDDTGVPDDQEDR